MIMHIISALKFLIPLCFAMASIASGQIAPVGLDQRTRAQFVGTLEFYILGTYWKPVQYHVESFRASRDPSVDLAQHFVGLRIGGILAGE